MIYELHTEGGKSNGNYILFQNELGCMQFLSQVYGLSCARERLLVLKYIWYTHETRYKFIDDGICNCVRCIMVK